MTYDALNAYGTFSEGDTLTGKVTLVLLKETTVESFFVKAKGDAKVHWTTKSGERTQTYSSNRRFFKLKHIFMPEGSGRSMPSSFKGNHGKIVYMLEAKLSRSWKFDRTVEKKINFVSKSFLNLHSLMSNQVGSVEKDTGLFSKGVVHMDAIVDRRAYAPGETAVIVAKINNSSSSNMTPKFSLIQNVVYRANNNTKHEGNIIQKVSDNCITPQTQREVYLDISFAFDPVVLFPVVIIPPDLVPGHQPGVSVGPYPDEATGGPSNSDFPPSAVSGGCYPPSPYSGSYGYPEAQQYSAHSVGPPTHMRGGYNNPVPRQPSPYGSPFSSSSSSSVLHPPPTVPTFHSPPSAPALYPSPSAPPTLNISPTVPPYNLPSAPMMNTDFLSQNDEPPPSYALLFPSSATNKPDAE
ncbi:hypothetical protein PAMP_022463 [Pampus punctatissimus]